MRYPLRGGLAISPAELGFDEVGYIRGATSNHHLYYERRSYRDVRWRSVFRNLVDNIVTLPNKQHLELHKQYQAPRVPRDTQMIGVLQDYLDEHGVIDCVKEHETNTVYQIQGEEWELIKGLYRKAA